MGRKSVSWDTASVPEFVQGAAGSNEKREQAYDALVALSGAAYGDSNAACAPVLWRAVMAVVEYAHRCA